MIVCKTVIIAQQIIIDMFTQKLTAVNILEDSTLNSDVSIFPLSVFTVFYRSKKDSLVPKIFLNIYFNEEILGKIELNIQFKKDTLIARNVATLGAIKIDKEGLLKFKILDEQGNILKENDYQMTFAN